MTQPRGSQSNRVAAGIGLSRIAGLIREIFIAVVLGTGADAFRWAMRIPNLVQNLLGEGSLSAAFVPVYAAAVQRGEDDPHGPDAQQARQLASAVLGFGLAIVVLLVAVIVLAAEPLVTVTTLGRVSGERFRETVELTQITAVGVGFLVIAAWCLGVLNAHREYLVSYSAPVVWNLAQIVALGAAISQLDATETQTAARWLAIAMVVGSVAQVVVQLPKLGTAAGLIMPSFQRSSLLSEVRRRMLPAIASRGIVQLSSWVDLMLTALLVSGAASIMGLSLPLYLLPISIFGFSVATAELTEMSRVSSQTEAVTPRIRIGLRKVALAGGLCSAGLIFGGGSIAATLYEWPSRITDGGGLSSDATVVLGLTLAAFGLALPAVMTARITQNALYALGDVKGPARIAAVRLVVLVVVGVLAMFQLDRLWVLDGQFFGGESFPHSDFLSPVADRENPIGVHLGTIGIGLGSAAASWVEFALLRRRLNSVLGEKIHSGIALGVTAAASVAGVTILAIRVLADLAVPVEGFAIGAAGLIAYIGTLRLLGYRPRARLGSAP